MQLSTGTRLHAPTRCSTVRAPRHSSTAVTALFGKKKEDPRAVEREEQWRVQQEVLARRKTGEWKKEVDERRADVSKYLNDPEYKKQVDAVKRKRLDAERAQVEAEINEKFKGFKVIIPINPMGNPIYDGGERFDLRGKYVDQGWVDEESDVMKKIGNFFKGKKDNKDEGKK